MNSELTLGDILGDALKRINPMQVYLDYTRVTALARFIVKHVGSDKKIECIKELRTFTGLPLKESKDIIEVFLPSASEEDRVRWVLEGISR